MGDYLDVVIPTAWLEVLARWSRCCNDECLEKRYLCFPQVLSCLHFLTEHWLIFGFHFPPQSFSGTFVHFIERSNVQEAIKGLISKWSIEWWQDFQSLTSYGHFRIQNHQEGMTIDQDSISSTSRGGWLKRLFLCIKSDGSQMCHGYWTTHHLNRLNSFLREIPFARLGWLWWPRPCVLLKLRQIIRFSKCKNFHKEWLQQIKWIACRILHPHWQLRRCYSQTSA